MVQVVSVAVHLKDMNVVSKPLRNGEADTAFAAGNEGHVACKIEGMLDP